MQETIRQHLALEDNPIAQQARSETGTFLARNHVGFARWTAERAHSAFLEVHGLSVSLMKIRPTEPDALLEEFASIEIDASERTPGAFAAFTTDMLLHGVAPMQALAPRAVSPHALATDDRWSSQRLAVYAVRVTGATNRKSGKPGLDSYVAAAAEKAGADIVRAASTSCDRLPGVPNGREMRDLCYLLRNASESAPFSLDEFDGLLAAALAAYDNNGKNLDYQLPSWASGDDLRHDGDSLSRVRRIKPIR